MPEHSSKFAKGYTAIYLSFSLCSKQNNLWQQLIVNHPIHVLLYDGLHLKLHFRLFLNFSFEVILHQEVVKRIHTLSLLAIKLQHIAILHILVSAVKIVHGVGFFHRRRHQVATERKEGLVVTQYVEHRWQDIYLLGNVVV